MSSRIDWLGTIPSPPTGALAVLLFASGCWSDRPIGDDCGSIEKFAVDASESWKGVTPLDSAAMLDGLSGKWTLTTSEEERVAVLESRAELAGQAQVWEP